MRQSAGLLLYRETHQGREVFLVHPGGPFWAKRDDGSWSIPKGEFVAGEDPFVAAQREFTEETGFIASGEFLPLDPIKQPSGKMVYAWAVSGDCDPARLKSNTFTLKGRAYPEVDRGAWFPLEVARHKLLAGQLPFLEQLSARAPKLRDTRD